MNIMSNIDMLKRYVKMNDAERNLLFLTFKKEISIKKDKKERLSDLIDVTLQELDLNLDHSEIYNDVFKILSIDNKYGIRLKIINKIPFIYVKESPYILLSKLSKLYIKYEIKEQVNTIRSIPSFLTPKLLFKYILYFSLIGTFLGGVEAIFLTYFSLGYEKYLYPAYCLILCLFTLIIFKFNLKIILVSISLFGITRYLFYYHDELSKFYSQSYFFEIYVASIIFLIVFSIFLLDFILYCLYFIMNILTNFFTFLYYYIKMLSKSVFYFMIPLFFYWNYLIFESIRVSRIMDLNIESFMILIKLILFLAFNMLIMFFSLWLSYTLKTGSRILSLEKIITQMYSNAFIYYPFFKLHSNINKYISEVHENVHFIRDFKFYNLKEIWHVLYLSMIFLWGYNIYNFNQYFQSYQYNKSFFEANNGYCSNIGKTDLILKDINSNTTILTITDVEAKESYIYKTGYKNITSSLGGRLFALKSVKDSYYVYERKCDKKISN